MMQRTLFVSVIFLSLFVLSCSKGSPVMPDNNPPDRIIDDFAPAVQLFGFSDECSDADIAEVLQGPGYASESYWGIPWTDNNPSGEAWAVAVTRCVSNGVDRVQYRFVGEGTAAEHLGPVLDLKDDVDGDIITGDIMFPRVASCVFVNSEHLDETDYTFVEVTVVFQIWDSVSSLWQIRAVRMGFDRNDFYDNLSNIAPVWVDDFIFNNNNAYGDEMPDVAYDPRNEQGDLHLVFTRWRNSLHTANRIYIKRADRAAEPFRNVDWSSISYVLEDVRNGYHARIDIGKCAFSPLYEDWNRAVSYTGQAVTFKPCLVYSDADEYGYFMTVYDIQISHWTWPNEAGGMPIVDIGPPGVNLGAIVWTQSRSIDWNSITVAYADTRGAIADFEPDDPTAESWAFPSIAIHNDTSGDIRSSISYLYNEDPSVGGNYWNPSARYVDAPDGGWATLGDEIGISNSAHGKWDAGSLVTHYYGMNTALTVFNDNYWMLWSSFTSGATPNTIYGTRGFTY